MLIPMLSISHSFTGGSRPHRAKAPVNRGHRQNPPRNQSNRRRLLHLEHNEERDVYVHPRSVTEAARARSVARYKKDLDLRREAAKRLKFSQLDTLKGLSTHEYIEMRVMDFYNMDKNSRLPTFWRTEQELFMKDIYKKLKSNKVCPMQPINLDRMLEAHNREYFEEAYWVTEKMGLHPLMKISEQYNIELIHQFYATVTFGSSPNIPITWMSGDEVCHSDFVEFAAVLGYPFDPERASGARMHNQGMNDKRKLAPIYAAEDVIFGQSTDIKTVYNTMLRMFRHTIAPQAGNIDQLRGGLVNLMAHSHFVLCRGKNYTGDDVKVDVMDYIYHEMYSCIMDKKAPVYAPFIMKLITRHSASPLCSVNLVRHDPAKIQRKEAPSSKKHAPLVHDDEEEYDDEEYADDFEGEESPPAAVDHTARNNRASNVFRIKDD